MMLLFWLIMGIGIYFLCTSREQATPATPQYNAEDVLKARYVNGEIDSETFQRMLHTLRD